MHVLIAEDDYDLGRQLRVAFEEAGFEVSVAMDGEEAHFLGETVSFDAIVLDVGLPIMDGIYVLSLWRDAGIHTPVLILTIRDREQDHRAGWTAGCEAYLTKPIYPWEVVANIRSLIRSRTAKQSTPVLRCGSVCVDTELRVVTINRQQVHISRKPYQTLVYLLHNKGKIVSRDELLDHLYSWDSQPETNTIESYISTIRKLIGRKLIRTDPGFGYVLECPEDETEKE